MTGGRAPGIVGMLSLFFFCSNFLDFSTVYLAVARVDFPQWRKNGRGQLPAFVTPIERNKIETIIQVTHTKKAQKSPPLCQKKTSRGRIIAKFPCNCYLMATSVEVLTRRSGRRKPLSTPATTSNSTLCSSFLKQVLLHDWWLIKADSDSHGKQLGIGGFTLKEGQVMRSFYSAPIVKRSDAVTLKTIDGITIMVHGYINRSRTLENGFSDEVCDHFLIGFPYYWEEFAAPPVSEEPADLSGSKGVSRSDAHKAPAPGDKETNMLSRTIFDAMLGEASSAKKESSLPIQTPASVNHRKTNAEKRRRDGSNVEYVKRSGPLTRSRARLLDN